MFAERVKTSNDAASQIAGRERRRHRHRPKGSSPVIEVSRRSRSGQDLQTTLRRIDHDNDGPVALVAECTQQLSSLFAQVTFWGADEDREVESALGVSLVYRTLDRLHLTRREGITSGHYIHPPLRLVWLRVRRPSLHRRSRSARPTTTTPGGTSDREPTRA